ncbi:uncharacterized protein LOC119068089 [Bradysia coprophila]|uniref:uncharacterized protein LOC119068089 n=1 Tax=Bradysia coprophila TaxID=38358 RepID=UPI00187D7E06|nr:uncharacterized protein LOC119068089 [Bradysia coprophila]
MCSRFEIVQQTRFLHHVLFLSSKMNNNYRRKREAAMERKRKHDSESSDSEFSDSFDLRLDEEFNEIIKRIKIEKSNNKVEVKPCSSSTSGNSNQSNESNQNGGQNNRSTNVIWRSPLEFLKSTIYRQQ